MKKTGRDYLEARFKEDERIKNKKEEQEYLKMVRSKTKSWKDAFGDD